MKRTTMALAVAACFYVLSWFVPVVADQESAVPGWEAFRVALSPIWPYRGAGGGSSFWDVLGVISALSNLWFVLSFALHAFFPMKSRGVVFGGLVVAALVNTFWLLLADIGDLRIGYYLWLGSFVILALATRWASPRAAGSEALSTAV